MPLNLHGFRGIGSASLEHMRVTPDHLPGDGQHDLAEIEGLMVETDSPARVVVNERTGTIVIGHDVKISQVAVSYGTLTVRVNEMPTVVQPAPFSDGVTAVEPATDIYADAEGGQVAIIYGPDLRSLVAGLNSIGVKPDGIISILQGIKSAGALQAELVRQ